jgi:hypothetical protein
MRRPTARDTLIVRVPAALSTFVLALALAGCGEPVGGTRNETLYPAKGQVLLANGKPLSGGTVVFIPASGQDASPRGEIGPDGNFVLKTRDADGAPAGKYKVRIEPPLSAMKKGRNGLADLGSLPFPRKYTDEDGDTGLTATVKTEPTTLEPFTLTAGDPKGGARDKGGTRD